MENKKTTSNLELANKGLNSLNKIIKDRNDSDAKHKKLMSVMAKFVKGNKK